ncbi:MAG: BMC domain-containing protein [Eubacteriales bacterium]|nr:BMC domain-containing protein [Eubacteriales bacterium]
MREEVRGLGFADVEFDNLVACLMAMDAAAKTANVYIQGVERNRLGAGACVKIRGSISDVRAALETAVEVGSRYGTLTGKHMIASPSEDTEIAINATIFK